jgi:tRNA A37 threonylcarbamoyladenosine synthetase subunit TsaC/SUA5/YrdC
MKNPFQPFDYEADAKAAWDTIYGGGIAVFTSHVGYAMCSATTAAIDKIFKVKRRTPAKFHAMSGNMDLHKELHVIDDRARDVLALITEGYGLPLGTIAPVRLDHPIIQGLPDHVREQTVKNASLAMLMNAGVMNELMAAHGLEHGRLILGSSANISQQGTKFRVEDIEPDIREAADIVIDHGVSRWESDGRSSTMLNIQTLEVIRMGAAYNVIRDALQRHMNVELPPAPAA